MALSVHAVVDDPAPERDDRLREQAHPLGHPPEGALCRVVAWDGPHARPGAAIDRVQRAYAGPAPVGPGLASAAAGLRVRPERYLADGEVVVVLGRATGHTPAGRDLDLPVVHVWTGPDPAAPVEHLDTAALQAALGDLGPVV